jgi:hypothetical protein
MTQRLRIRYKGLGRRLPVEIQKAHKFFNRPNVICNPCFHRRTYAQSLVNPAGQPNPLRFCRMQRAGSRFSSIATQTGAIRPER